GDGITETHCIRTFAHRSLDLLMAGVADQEDAEPARRVVPHLGVHLRHERAGRVNRPQAAGPSALVYDRRDTVGGEDGDRAFRYLLLAFDEHGAALLELANDVSVVDDLLSDVDRTPVPLESLFDGVHGPLDAGAVPPRRREENPLDHREQVELRAFCDPSDLTGP